ncbi:MAG: ABC transporter permease [Selenomonadaceae bacterium]|nr:ABC transporter permease [Selenomonadaceae bacterium]MBQ9497653.1 ABC transporter permease [Selenomonadaceae bacterium]
MRNFYGDVLTIMWRDWIVLRRRLKKFILSRLVTPVLYLVAFGWGLGKNINLASGSYLDFLVPGIVALNTMNVSYMSVTSVHAERVYHKSLEEYLSAPIEPAAFVFGKIFSAVVRALISTALILGVAWIFGASLKFFSAPLNFFVVVVLNSIIFAGVCFCAALKVQTYEELAQVNTYLLMPMSFLCGTFFSTAELPPAVRFVIEILPLTHTSQLLREGFNLPSLIILAAYAILSLWLATRWFRRLSS